MCHRDAMIDLSKSPVEMKPDVETVVVNGRLLVINSDSGVYDFGPVLFGLPPFDPGVTSTLDPATGETVVCRDGEEVARLAIDHEPSRPWTAEDQRRHDQMLADHLNPSTC